MPKILISLILVMALQVHGVFGAAPSQAKAPEPPAGPPEIPQGDMAPPAPDFGGELPMPEDPAPPATMNQPPSSGPRTSAEPAVVKTEPQPAVGTPEPKGTVPTPVPRKPVPVKAKPVPAAPTPTSTAAAAPAIASRADLPPAANYFPAAPGEKKEYQFFLSPGQEVGRKNRVAECLESQANPDGTVKTVIKTTVFAGGSYGDEISTDTYLASGNGVSHTDRNGQPLSNRFLFKMPKPGGVERWLHQEKDGSVRYYKATFSPLKANDRIYPDCIVVVEKTVMKAGGISLRYLYYARGSGLIRLEVYGQDLKIDRSSSIDIVGTGASPGEAGGSKGSPVTGEPSPK